ncbi:hypothetical protein LINGRAHAP2_LOCUS36930 [Linum grandiflorum]
MDTKMVTLSKAKRVQSARWAIGLQNLVLNSLVVMGFSLLLYSPTKQLVLLHVPNLVSCLTSHACVFLLVNIIVVFLLVGESRLESLVGRWQLLESSSTSGGDAYDEYIRRARTVKEEEPVVVKEEETQVEVEAADETVSFHDAEVGEEVEDKQVIVCEEKVEEEVEEEEEEERKEVEEVGKGDELNRRIEEFIARVNRQRQIEIGSGVRMVGITRQMSSLKVN